VDSKRSAWVFAIIYTAISMGVEIILIVVFRLKIPQHNAIIAPIILTLPPVLAGWFAGYRAPKELAVLAAPFAFRDPPFALSWSSVVSSP
jgi:hypothetical protein